MSRNQDSDVKKNAIAMYTMARLVCPNEIKKLAEYLMKKVSRNKPGLGDIGYLFAHRFSLEDLVEFSLNEEFVQNLFECLEIPYVENRAMDFLKSWDTIEDDVNRGQMAGLSNREERMLYSLTTKTKIYYIKAFAKTTVIKNVPPNLNNSFHWIYYWIQATIWPHSLTYDIPTTLIEEHPDIALAAVRSSGRMIEYVPYALLLIRPDIVLAAVEKRGLILRYVPLQLKLMNPNICLAAVKDIGAALQFVPDEIKMTHLDIVRIAVQEDPFALNFVPQQLQMNNPDITMLAVMSHGMSLRFVSDELQSLRPDISKEAVRNHGIALFSVSADLQRARPDIAMAAVTNDAEALEFVPGDVQAANPDIVYAAIDQDRTTIRFVSNEFIAMHGNPQKKKKKRR